MDQRQATLEQLVQPTIDGLGYELVRVVVSGKHRPTIQIMAERRDGKGMTVEDCEAISRALSAKLDVEDPIADSYTLEVSSPGIDRPLVKPRDYARFAGHLAKIELKSPIAGQRRFTGKIVDADETTVRIAAVAGEVTLPLAEVARAKLLLTDDLIRAAQAGQATH
ncbi:MAG: ribosome maturation factor RimP [Alphaproteobacteria bacterium]|nr:ribosome maturation factor RimP [Alphaproteobacteria bacterium]